jgi:hypothetical protein
MNYPDDDIIDPAKAVEKQTGLSRHTLIRMRQRPEAGGLPFVRLTAKRIGYRRGDVRAFIAARRVGTLHAA